MAAFARHSLLVAAALVLALRPLPAAGDYLVATGVDSCSADPSAEPAFVAATMQGCMVFGQGGGASAGITCVAGGGAQLSVWENGDCSGAPYLPLPFGSGGCDVLEPDVALVMTCAQGSYTPSTNASLTLWVFEESGCPPTANAPLTVALTVPVPTACEPVGWSDASRQYACDVASQQLRVSDFADAACAGAPVNVTTAPLGCAPTQPNTTEVGVATCGQRLPFASSSAAASSSLTSPSGSPLPSSPLRVGALRELVRAWAARVKARAVAAAVAAAASRGLV